MVFVHSILIRYRRKTVDIAYDIQILGSLYTRYWYDIEFLFDIVYDIVLQYRDITISKVKTLMSYRISVKYRNIRISTFSLRYQRFGRYWVQYVIPGAAGRTGHVPAPPTRMGAASWSSTRLDGLYFCVTVLTPFPAGVQQLLSVAAVARSRSRWAALISSYRSLSTSDW
jgi:hypothetical protein